MLPDALVDSHAEPDVSGGVVGQVEGVGVGVLVRKNVCTGDSQRTASSNATRARDGSARSRRHWSGLVANAYSTAEMPWMVGEHPQRERLGDGRDGVELQPSSARLRENPVDEVGRIGQPAVALAAQRPLRGALTPTRCPGSRSWCTKADPPRLAGSRSTPIR